MKKKLRFNVRKFDFIKAVVVYDQVFCNTIKSLEFFSEKLS